jgi:hypothetical protein
MAETPEERAIQKRLDDLVDEFIAVHGWNEGVITSYVLVAHTMMPPDDNGDDRSSYVVIYRTGSQPDHIAEGLLRMGIARLREGRAERSEDG